MVRLSTSSSGGSYNSSSSSTIPSSPSSFSLLDTTTNGSSSSSSSLAATLNDLVKYIPLRLTEEERSLLTVLEQTLNVSEYTDHVDVAMSVSRRGVKARRILDGILEVCHIAIGLTIASGHGRLFQLQTDDDRKNHKKTRASNPFRAKKKKKETSQHNHHNGSQQQQHSNRLAAATTTTCPPTSSSNISLKPYAPLLQRMFEVGRRNKVLNPNQMRTTYGKLMYLLQDAQSPSIAKSLGFSLFQELHLVGPYLEQNKAACLLRDERLLIATQYIAANTNAPTTDSNETENEDGNQGKKPAISNDRAAIQQRVAQKHQALEALVDEYSTPATALSTDEVRRCIESIADAIAYVQANVTPVHAMMNYLTTRFDPQQVHNGFSLEIQSSGGGSSGLYSRYNLYDNRYSSLSTSYNSSSSSSSSGGGATLNHSHSTQFTFVWQTLQLWSKVMHHMHALWVCADSDLLSTGTSYHLYNTGQGLQRVQSCPKVAKAMRQLLVAAQQQTQSNWVGLSVIHLGDRDVPNALIFIDKYAQIPRFLHPLVDVCQSLPVAQSDARLERYIVRQFTTVDRLVQIVLTDYFKHGFDGSGDDGGSCIDGRLTSSWNWTSRLAKKPYYYAFLLCGFQGFDGDFK